MTINMASDLPRRPSALVHLVGGGLGGCVGALVTCPLDVIQTRLQSSAFKLQRSLSKATTPAMSTASVESSATLTTGRTFQNKFKGILSYARYMAESEGFFALYKGLAPILVGVIPSRAIYFAAYSKLKDFFNHSGVFKENGNLVHMNSAAIASFVNHTATNPIWFVKTRLQLENQGPKRVSFLEVIKKAYNLEGFRAFYRGLSASYIGISETVFHFVIYERAKAKLLELHFKSHKDLKVFECMFAAGLTKIITSGLCYPTEVARTRLRQQESAFLGQQKYHTFFQTLKIVAREEGIRGLYGGLGTHLIRQVPNTAIVFFTYEGVVHMLEQNEEA